MLFGYHDHVGTEWFLVDDQLDAPISHLPLADALDHNRRRGECVSRLRAPRFIDSAVD
jgi:hypothetical protein